MKKIEENEIIQSKNIVFRNLSSGDFVGKIAEKIYNERFEENNSTKDIELVFVNILEKNRPSNDLDGSNLKYENNECIIENISIYELSIPDLIKMIKDKTKANETKDTNVELTNTYISNT